MEKQTGRKLGGSYLSAVMIGTACAVLFCLMLLLAAMVSESKPTILTHGAWTAKVCLLIIALLCGVLAGRRAGQRMLLHALTAEGVLLAFLTLCVIGCGNEIRFASVLIDLLFLLFGAFAGTEQGRRGRIKRRGKR